MNLFSNTNREPLLLRKRGLRQRSLRQRSLRQRSLRQRSLLKRSGFGITITMCLVFTIVSPPFVLGQDEAASSDVAVLDEGNAGQDKLDEATDKKIGARSPADLGKVIELCEEAIELGLNEGNLELAKQLVAATSLQRAQMMVQQLPRLANNPNSLRRLRRTTMQDLEKAVENNPELAEAFILMARLETIPGGDREKAGSYVEKAIELLEDRPVDQSKAYILRAAMREKNEDRLEDLGKAIEADSTNAEAWQMRMALQLAMGKLEETVSDAEELLSLDDSNMIALEAAIRALLELKKTDQVVEMMTKRIEKDSQNGVYYRVRARAHILAEENDLALKDLDKAIELDNRDFESLVLRGQLFYDLGEIDKANRDITDSLLIEPNSIQGIVMRSLVAAREERYTDAIEDMEMLVRANPNNPGWVMQLASYYQLDERPRRAISLLDELIRRNPKEWRAMRLRGDAKLAIAEHVDAIRDYESALKILEDVAEEGLADDDDFSGALNNLAWVLATSPNDEVRNGEKSVEYGLRACELTDYNKAHILSTLAAGYAEKGDFENARKWSEKSVEVGEAETPPNPQIDQLKKELESYKNNKPWREEQKTEENEKPLSTAGETIDT